jgi:hypothetical protein
VFYRDTSLIAYSSHDIIVYADSFYHMDPLKLRLNSSIGYGLNTKMQIDKCLGVIVIKGIRWIFLLLDNRPYALMVDIHGIYRCAKLPISRTTPFVIWQNELFSVSGKLSQLSWTSLPLYSLLLELKFQEAFALGPFIPASFLSKTHVRNLFYLEYKFLAPTDIYSVKTVDDLLDHIHSHEEPDEMNLLMDTIHSVKVPLPEIERFGINKIKFLRFLLVAMDPDFTISAKRSIHEWLIPNRPVRNPATDSDIFEKTFLASGIQRPVMFVEMVKSYMKEAFSSVIHFDTMDIIVEYDALTIGDQLLAFTRSFPYRSFRLDDKLVLILPIGNSPYPSTFEMKILSPLSDLERLIPLEYMISGLRHDILDMQYKAGNIHCLMVIDGSLWLYNSIDNSKTLARTPLLSTFQGKALFWNDKIIVINDKLDKSTEISLFSNTGLMLTTTVISSLTRHVVLDGFVVVLYDFWLQVFFINEFDEISSVFQSDLPFSLDNVTKLKWINEIATLMVLLRNDQFLIHLPFLHIRKSQD